MICYLLTVFFSVNNQHKYKCWIISDSIWWCEETKNLADYLLENVLSFYNCESCICDLYLLSDSIFYCQIKSFSHHTHALFCFFIYFIKQIIFKQIQLEKKNGTRMLEVEITQQRSIHTTKWEIVLGMKINDRFFFCSTIFLFSQVCLYIK